MGGPQNPKEIHERTIRKIREKMVPKPITRAGLTIKQEEAAYLLAEGELTQQEIAKKLGIGSPRTLRKWAEEIPQFSQRIAQRRKQFADWALKHGIADKTIRVEKKKRRYEKLEEIVRQRAEEHQAETQQGLSTGLVLHTRKGIGSGRDYETVDEYKVDTGILGAMSALEEEIAIEVGDRNRDFDPFGPTGSPVFNQFNFNFVKPGDVQDASKQLIEQSQ